MAHCATFVESKVSGTFSNHSLNDSKSNENRWRIFIAKNEVAKTGSTTPAYSQKDFDTVTSANVTDIHREIVEPGRYTTEDIHSETVVSSTSSSKKK